MRDTKRPLLSRRKVLKATGLGIAASAFGATRAIAAPYPDRPIKIIVPFAPAGPTDIMARILGHNLGATLPGSLIIENRAGAGGNLGTGYAAHSEADGYTLLITSSAYVVNPSLYTKIPYDPFKDFLPISELGTSPNAIMIDPKLGINSMAELIARAKAKPDELNYASPGAGTTPHLSGELLKIEARIDITHVPFQGAGPAIQALLGGVTQLAVTALPPAVPYINSGQIKALAVTGARRWVDLLNVPTMVELGYPNFIADTFQAFLAPAKTPPEIVALLATKSVDVLKKPEIVDQLRVNGFEVIASGSDGLRRRIESDVPKWRDVIAKAGIKPV